MARHKKIDVRMWGDGRFRSLSKPQPNGQTLWVYLLTGPHTTSIPGLFVSGEAALAESLGWPVKAFRDAFKEVVSKEMCEYDPDARVIWIPKAIHYNHPESANVIKSWRIYWDEIPECALKTKAHGYLKAFLKGLSKGYAEAFNITCEVKIVDPSPNQEQEQEQEQEWTSPKSCSEPTESASEPPVMTFPVVGKGPSEYPLTQSKIDEYAVAFPGVDVLAQMRKARQWCIDTPVKRKTFGGMPKFLSGWLGREQDRAARLQPTNGFHSQKPTKNDRIDALYSTIPDDEPEPL